MFPEPPAWIREAMGQTRPYAEDMALLRRGLLVLVALAWALIAAGVSSGILLLLRRRAGRWLALALCAGLLLWGIVDHARLIALHGWRANRMVWALLARQAPSHVASALLNVVFYALTLVYLGRRSAGKHLCRGAVDNDRYRQGPAGSDRDG